MLRNLSNFGEGLAVTHPARLHGMLPFYWDNGALLDRYCKVREGNLWLLYNAVRVA